MRSANSLIKSVSRIEPARLEEVPESVADVVASLSAAGAVLGSALHPTSAANLAVLVRIMNTYYSNLIEGHDTRPRDIERALAGNLDRDEGRRNLQLEAAAHVRVQAEVDRMASEDNLPEPASPGFIRWLHREFYRDAPAPMLRICGTDTDFVMEPGEWRSRPEHDVAVGRHLPPSSDRVNDFIRYFEQRYRFADLGKAARIMAIASAHHRLNYIHPFPDGNGRVSRLMSPGAHRPARVERPDRQRNACLGDAEGAGVAEVPKRCAGDSVSSTVSADIDSEFG
ncbi:fic/DOC family protein [bacterium BMS3Bbin12]|nr:fic/DOC family protein [bacterium BMS3Abin12]GBE48026.1 fic/DOC family protein [bacterium BMS3Bbin12]GBE50261.1 fic/DOC family protein [bacterium BMS3Bbin13]